ncbi:DNA-binding domain, methylated-DNA-[protein]-cysteine S-methyltransferase family protein [Leptospira fainei serovar Hurstbridge str. BUT 6]|uniref:Methylated-DNA--protein-cysteine methyltransferase n=1 Tax=Leptospira fainei serovar Hurstbridge str. BUT 6 TaxID=1193011 RepID=S3W4K2_9LEPT|nr:methylated-DNA--[protein]-cysteine S-methyltransferase [Leptospira fainei]EPG75207.1 DNA-binding domain, methylated-DNA-[protein]-cysteine S-methyltransferase family protein [Leptospira fainei serovar Hurstbridge str. BUT 6]
MTYYAKIGSPIGELLIVSNGISITRICMDNQKYGADIEEDWIERSNLEPISLAREQLNAYFAGHLKKFDLPLTMIGTPFQKRVWAELIKIPFGEIISYGELARRIDNPNASRAVGLANGKNPMAIVVPCHRVIGSNGSLTGYGGGLPNKQYLLEMERTLEQGNVNSASNFEGDLWTWSEQNELPLKNGS